MKRTRFPAPPSSEVERVRSLAKTIGAALRASRAALGKTQDDVASAAGTWQRQLSQVECGRALGVRFETLARALDRCGQRDLFAEAKEELARESNSRRRARSG